MKKDFQIDFSAECRIIRVSLALVLLVVFLSAVVVYFRLSAFHWFVIAGMFVMLFGLIGVGSYLWIRYVNLPEVSEKARMGPRLIEHDEKIVRAKEQIKNLEDARTKLDLQEQTQLSLRNGQFNDVLNEIKERRSLAENEFRQTRQISLRQLQNSHLRNGLMHHYLAEANIPNLNPEVLAALTEKQIVTAHDLGPEWLEQIQMDEVSHQALLNWRDELETKYRGTQPKELSQNEVSQINQEYENKISRLDRDEIIAKAALEKDYLEIREQNTKFREANRERLQAARSALRGLEEKKLALLEEQVSYTSITFFRYFEYVLSHTLGITRPTWLGEVVIQSSVLIILLFQGVLSIQATQTIITDLPPTEAVQTIPVVISGEQACIPTNTVWESGIVARIIDGDTIEVAFGEDLKRVRYIGVDSPEPEQNLGGLALYHNSQMVAGMEVILIKDTSDEDQFGRLLRYVLVGETFVNFQMVAKGYARASAFPPDIACQTIFERAEKTAQEKTLGMWAFIGTPDMSQPSEEINADSGTASPLNTVCSCQGNTMNCSDFTTRAEAQACFDNCILEGAGDIHRLDGNADGLACENLP